MQRCSICHIDRDRCPCEENQPTDEKILENLIKDYVSLCDYQERLRVQIIQQRKKMGQEL